MRGTLLMELVLLHDFGNFYMQGERYYFCVKGIMPGRHKVRIPTQGGDDHLRWLFRGWWKGPYLSCTWGGNGHARWKQGENTHMRWKLSWEVDMVEMVMQGDFSGSGGGNPIWHACKVEMVIRGDLSGCSGGDPIWSARKVGMVAWGMSHLVKFFTSWYFFC